MKWAMDVYHSSVTFTIRHMMSKVRGQMKIKEGWIEVDNDNLSTAKVDVVLDAATIDTGVEMRDNHLRSADGHFDVENYPTITFKSTRVEVLDPAHWKVTGDLTIHGVARPVLLDTHDLGQAMQPFAKKIAAGFRAETAVDRRDFGVTWNAAMGTGGAYLGERVQISLSILALLQ